MNRPILIIVLVLAVFFAIGGAMFREQAVTGITGVELDDITMIGFRNGQNGQLTEISDPAKIREFTLYLSSFRLRRSFRQQPFVGYPYYADFYRGTETAFRITFTNPLNINGTYYTMAKDAPDINDLNHFIGD
jgi:hypothetical protein